MGTSEVPAAAETLLREGDTKCVALSAWKLYQKTTLNPAPLGHEVAS